MAQRGKPSLLSPRSSAVHDARVLTPFDPREAIAAKEAAYRFGVSVTTVRTWCVRQHIGRQRCGRWFVSAPAVEMFADGQHEALAAYLKGDRSNPTVVRYFHIAGVPLPEQRATSAVAA